MNVECDLNKHMFRHVIKHLTIYIVE